MSVPLDGVEKELSKLWDSTTRKDGHAVSFNLVAFCASPDDLPRARGALARVALEFPSRTLSVACYASTAPEITARVALHCHPSEGHEPRSEDVDLEVRGGARAWVPGTLVKLRVPDLPVYVWWVGDLPDEDTLFDRLVEHADVVFVHSAEMDLRDLSRLSSLVEWAKGGYAIGDLNWARLRWWQEFTARFFDDPASRAHLGALERVTVAHTPREPGAPMSTQAALYAAWLAVALGWDTSAPRWSRDGATTTLTLRRGDGQDVTVRFVEVPRDDILAGCLDRAVFEAGGCRWELYRSDNPRVLCWHGEGEGLVLPSLCVRVDVPDEARMLSRLLHRPERDALFERTLHAAARLTAPVAPAAPVGADGGGAS
ncbi:MAG: glucose-6-phosphate dehydrogenase assembly protein OpcA [Deltaproteobacteria bacterium]|nr:glucose-6-phosphate dehydrogenase assembly protein OpcA [Deltaproteobacteria bacterium]